jgi:hypothetical protein
MYTRHRQWNGRKRDNFYDDSDDYDTRGDPFRDNFLRRDLDDVNKRPLRGRSNNRTDYSTHQYNSHTHLNRHRHKKGSNNNRYGRHRSNHHKKQEESIYSTICDHHIAAGDRIIDKHLSRRYIYHRKPFDWYNTQRAVVLDDVEELFDSETESSSGDYSSDYRSTSRESSYTDRRQRERERRRPSSRHYDSPPRRYHRNRTYDDLARFSPQRDNPKKSRDRRRSPGYNDRHRGQRDRRLQSQRDDDDYEYDDRDNRRPQKSDDQSFCDSDECVMCRHENAGSPLPPMYCTQEFCDEITEIYIDDVIDDKANNNDTNKDDFEKYKEKFINEKLQSPTAPPPPPPPPPQTLATRVPSSPSTNQPRQERLNSYNENSPQNSKESIQHRPSSQNQINNSQDSINKRPSPSNQQPLNNQNKPPRPIETKKDNNNNTKNRPNSSNSTTSRGGAVAQSPNLKRISNPRIEDLKHKSPSPNNSKSPIGSINSKKSYNSYNYSPQQQTKSTNNNNNNDDKSIVDKANVDTILNNLWNMAIEDVRKERLSKNTNKPTNSSKIYNEEYYNRKSTLPNNNEYSPQTTTNNNNQQINKPTKQSLIHTVGTADDLILPPTALPCAQPCSKHKTLKECDQALIDKYFYFSSAPNEHFEAN